jgi:hypothetical protein
MGCFWFNGCSLFFSLSWRRGVSISRVTGTLRGFIDSLNLSRAIWYVFLVISASVDASIALGPAVLWLVFRDSWLDSWESIQKKKKIRNIFFEPLYFLRMNWSNNLSKKLTNFYNAMKRLLWGFFNLCSVNCHYLLQSCQPIVMRKNFKWTNSIKITLIIF